VREGAVHRQVVGVHRQSRWLAAHYPLLHDLQPVPLILRSTKHDNNKLEAGGGGGREGKRMRETVGLGGGREIGMVWGEHFHKEMPPFCEGRGLYLAMPGWAHEPTGSPSRNLP
jgi:hypothetical protein